MVTAGVVRTLLIVDIVGMALLSFLYLRQRQMSRLAFLCWGLLALLVPVLGPLMVIALRPGRWNPSFSFKDDARRFLDFMNQMILRLLPVPPQLEKKSRAERLRSRSR